MRIVIMHGAHGGPDTNWFPSLSTELEGHGHEMVRPRFPTPDGQSLDRWFASYRAALGERPPAPTVLVGHSLGAGFALRVVERAAGPFVAVFLAAPFIGALGLPDYDGINASFFAGPFDWAGIRARAGACRCWAGDRDPYVPLPRSQAVADALGVPLQVVPGGGHLNGESGFTSFPALRDAVLAL